jgi:hypothetical protein
MFLRQLVASVVPVVTLLYVTIHLVIEIATVTMTDLTTAATPTAAAGTTSITAVFDGFLGL